MNYRHPSSLYTHSLPFCFSLCYVYIVVTWKLSSSWMASCNGKKPRKGTAIYWAPTMLQVFWSKGCICLYFWLFPHLCSNVETTKSRLAQGKWLTKPKSIQKYSLSGTSSVVQWLRLRASTAGGTGLIPGWGTKIPHAAWWNTHTHTHTNTDYLYEIIPVPSFTP